MATEKHTGDQWGVPIEGSRPTTEKENKGWARDQVALAAKRGRGPSTFRADDLEWAFGSSPEATAALEALEQQAEAVLAVKRESERRLRASGKVLTLAERLLKEQAQRRSDRLRAAAIREARRRLGLPPIE
jgi:hypothetical protein